jgi:hypothetical protein
MNNTLPTPTTQPKFKKREKPKEKSKEKSKSKSKSKSISPVFRTRSKNTKPKSYNDLQNLWKNLNKQSKRTIYKNTSISPPRAPNVSPNMIEKNALFQTLLESPQYVSLSERTKQQNWKPYFSDILKKQMYDNSLNLAILYFIDKYKSSRKICTISKNQNESWVVGIDYKDKDRRNHIVRVDDNSNKMNLAKRIIDCLLKIPQLVLVPVILVHNIGTKINGKYIIQQPNASSHQCLMIINCVLQTLEFYDPNGVRIHDDLYGNHILDIMVTFLKKIQLLKHFTFVNPYFSSLWIGFQNIESQSLKHNYGLKGYCVTWSIFYAELRIKYPDIPAKELYSYYIPMFRKSRNDFILDDILQRNPSAPAPEDLLREFIIEYTIHLEKYIEPYFKLGYK